MSADEPTMLDIVTALGDAYTDDGIAIILSARHKIVSPDRAVIIRCRTVEGRRAVYAWASTLGGMVAT